MSSSEESKQRYYYLKEHRICVRCGQRDAFHNSVSCEICKEKQEIRNEKSRESLSKSRKALYAKRVSEGMCVRCGKESATVGFKTCEKCRTKGSKARLELYHKKKHQCNFSYVREGLSEAQVATLEKAREASLKSAKSEAQRQKFREMNNKLLFNKGGNYSGSKSKTKND